MRSHPVSTGPVSIRCSPCQLGVFALLLSVPSTSAWPQDLADILSFEAGADKDFPAGWVGGPIETIGLSESVTRGGRGAGQIHRDVDSDQNFSSLTLRLPADVAGADITLSAWVRSSEVDGIFGLWLRQDGPGGPVDVRNNYNERLTGSLEWQETSVSARLSNRARTLNFGLMLSGTGTVWIDDVRLLIDGMPYAEVPKIVREVARWELDTEFVDGSGIESFVATNADVENVATLIEVWGFVKYHHPRVAAGDIHIDFELFRALPGVLTAANPTERNERIGLWLSSLGSFEPCSECAGLPDDVHLSAPISWIGDSARLGANVTSQLREIYENRPASGDYAFIDFNPGGNADFSGEPYYRSIQDADAGYRLLALARLWNVVQYWFPYRDQIDRPWREVLRRTIPRLTGDLDREAYVDELFLFVAEIHDTHANLWSVLDLRPPKGSCAIEADFRFIEGVAVIFPSDDLKPLRRGDVLIEIDGDSVSNVVERVRPFYAASNEAARMLDIGRYISKGVCGPAELKVRRTISNEDQTLDVTVNRVPNTDYLADYFRHDRAGPTYQELGQEVAYIKLSTIEQNDVEKFIRDAQGKKGLIVDIRNNPSSFMPFELGQRLIETKRPFAQVTKPDPANPGAFVWSETIDLTPAIPNFTGPVAILVDASTISQAEYTAMALRVGESARVIGSTTAGADGNSSYFYLPGGIQTAITGLGIFYPDKSPTQRVGIVPDIEAKPTVRGIREGRDEIIEAALRYILGSDISEEEIRRLAAYP